MFVLDNLGLIFLNLFVWGALVRRVLLGIWKRRCPRCGKFFAREIIKSKRKDKVTKGGVKYYIQWTDNRCKRCGFLWNDKGIYQ